MKKKISVLFFILVLCLNTAFPAFAAQTDGFVDEYYRVQDYAALLTEEEYTQLNEQLDELSNRQNMDVTIATTNDLEGYSVAEYADFVYEQCKFGYGEEKDGLLLLINMADSDWYISTCGYGITAFTDAGINYIGEEVVPYLSDGDYVGAFETYAELCDDFITQAQTGTPYDSGNLPEKPLSPLWIVVSIAVGVLIAFIIVSRMKNELKTVHSKAEANTYVRKSSLNITNSNDMFLYRTVNKTAKQKNNTSSGSSTHKSSSGTTHGGGGGKF